VTNSKNIQNAVKKARKLKCRARHIGNRRYEVTTPRGHVYVVRFEMLNGLRYAFCNCAAGSIGLACYHIVGAAHLDTALTGYMPPRHLRLVA
jgi:hypothetical protein